jgi:hypothetical protein
MATATKSKPKEAKNRPVHEIRFGRIRAAIWQNETENGMRHNGKRPTNPFLSGSVVWSPVSSGFQISTDEVVHERVGAVVA